MSYIEKFWRGATAADVTRAMAGDTVEARFRDLDREDWSEPTTLKGWTADGKRWLGYFAWNFCQVYDPPQWYVDKPDPGEGYRLLAKFPDEALQPGDEARLESGLWVRSDSADTGKPQQINAWYRRRIEQPKPEPKHYVLQVGDTADVPSGHRIAITEHGLEVT